MSKPEKPSSEFTLERRKLLFWLSTWNGNEEHAQNVNLDLPELSVLFQMLGFKCKAFEKIIEIDQKNVLSLELICQTSGTKSVFTKELSACQCPTKDEMEKAQVWSVTGCGPNASSQNSINSSTNSLIPTLSKGKIEICTYLLAKIFKIINEKQTAENVPAFNHNLTQNALLTRNRSLDALKDSTNPFKENLKREPSWEIDPPTLTSSPVPNVTHTLSQLSIEYDISDYTKDIGAIKNLVDEKWKKLQASNNNRTFKNKMPEIIPMKVNADLTPSTPRKKLMPKRYLTPRGSKTGISTPSYFRKTSASSVAATTAPGLDPTSAKSHLLRKSPIVGKSSHTVFKSKIGTPIIKSTIGSRSVAKLTQPSSSKIAKYTKKV